MFPTTIFPKRDSATETTKMGLWGTTKSKSQLQYTTFNGLPSHPKTLEDDVALKGPLLVGSMCNVDHRVAPRLLLVEVLGPPVERLE